mmetsp:Transcript_434/g.711  ORF Transcript_434/g.711 Transcript_434/m.711 type:complete len:280 (-) Transcript_434:171-1010(-)
MPSRSKAVERNERRRHRHRNRRRGTTRRANESDGCGATGICIEDKSDSRPGKQIHSIGSSRFSVPFQHGDGVRKRFARRLLGNYERRCRRDRSGRGSGAANFGGIRSRQDVIQIVQRRKFEKRRFHRGRTVRSEGRERGPQIHRLRRDDRRSQRRKTRSRRMRRQPRRRPHERHQKLHGRISRTSPSIGPAGHQNREQTGLEGGEIHRGEWHAFGRDGVRRRIRGRTLRVLGSLACSFCCLESWWMSGGSRFEGRQLCTIVLGTVPLSDSRIIVWKRSI